MLKRSGSARLLALTCGCLGGTILGISGCSSSHPAAANANAGTTTQAAAASTPAPAGSAQAAAGSSPTAAGSAPAAQVAGQPDLDAICPKLPVADAQPLIRSTLTAAVPDLRLGGCTFVLAGKTVGDNNLTVTFVVGGDAAGRYSDDVKGVITIGTTTMSAGPAITTPLSGVGDKAVWGTTAGYPTVSALSGDAYCSVSTADDATQLTIIGNSTNPLPVGNQAQDLQYAQLEGKLCVDLFGLVN
jgi:hypothetical protein